MNAPMTPVDDRYTPITDRSAWLHADMASSEDWQFLFTAQDLEELDAAIAANAGRAVTEIVRHAHLVRSVAPRRR